MATRRFVRLVFSCLVLFCHSCQSRLIPSCFVSIVGVHSSISSSRLVLSRPVSPFTRPFLCFVLFVFPPQSCQCPLVDFFVSSCFISLVSAVHWSFVDFFPVSFCLVPPVLLCPSPFVLSSTSCRLVSLALSAPLVLSNLSCPVSLYLLVSSRVFTECCQSPLVVPVLSCQSPLVLLVSTCQSPLVVSVSICQSPLVLSVSTCQSGLRTQ